MHGYRFTMYYYNNIIRVTVFPVQILTLSAKWSATVETELVSLTYALRPTVSRTQHAKFYWV